jgi:hypothetical protein
MNAVAFDAADNSDHDWHVGYVIHEYSGIASLQWIINTFWALCAIFVSRVCGANEVAFFGEHELLLDTEASASIFRSQTMLDNVRVMSKPTSKGGIDSSTPALNISMTGDFRNFGEVLFNENASANVLSFGGMKDHGCSIHYDDAGDYFSLTSPDGSSTYIFDRKPMPPGHKLSKRRMYSCISGEPVRSDSVLVNTVTNNMLKYTHSSRG